MAEPSLDTGGPTIRDHQEYGVPVLGGQGREPGDVIRDGNIIGVVLAAALIGFFVTAVWFTTGPLGIATLGGMAIGWAVRKWIRK